MGERRSMFRNWSTSFVGALKAISMGMAGNALDFRKPQDLPMPYRGGKARHTKKANKPGSNLRLHLGPSDSGRLMRNRTPSPVPVRLTVHDWFRRQHFGSSKRMKHMSWEERTRAQAAMEEFRRAQKM